LNKSQRRKSSAKNTNIQERERERESGIELRFIYLLTVRGWSGEFRPQGIFPTKVMRETRVLLFGTEFKMKVSGDVIQVGIFLFFYCYMIVTVVGTHSVHTHTNTPPRTEARRYSDQPSPALHCTSFSTARVKIKGRWGYVCVFSLVPSVLTFGPAWWLCPVFSLASWTLADVQELRRSPFIPCVPCRSDPAQ
jgi:hypothetical protein